MKIELPAEPVDGYEIKYFSIEYGRVLEHKLVYHANTRWADLYPDNPRGADIVDQWRLFDGNSFTGRCCGWKYPIERTDWDDEFATYDEAINGLRNRMTKTLKSLEQQADSLRLAIEELQ